MTAFEQFWPWRTRRRAQGTGSGAPTAQDEYKRMIDGQISPALRQLGMKGSGGRYELPSSRYWALLGFQKSAYSDSQAIRFTVNLTAVARDVWDSGAATQPHWGKRPSPGVFYGPEVPTERIGTAAGREDTWWYVRAGDHTAATAQEALSLIEEYGLPWLRGHMEEMPSSP